MSRLLSRLVVVPIAAIAAVVAGTSAAPADPATRAAQNVTALHTVLTGAQEIPGPGDDDGVGAFAAVIRGDRLCYALVATRIETATAAHIHAAPTGVAGGIVVGLNTPNPVSRGCITAVDDAQNTMATLTHSELAAIVANPSQFYVNVHNASFPAGAIRGQLG